jgi:hypothetical protein
MSRVGLRRWKEGTAGNSAFVANTGDTNVSMAGTMGPLIAPEGGGRLLADSADFRNGRDSRSARPELWTTGNAAARYCPASSAA